MLCHNIHILKHETKYLLIERVVLRSSCNASPAWSTPLSSLPLGSCRTTVGKSWMPFSTTDGSSADVYVLDNVFSGKISSSLPTIEYKYVSV